MNLKIRNMETTIKRVMVSIPKWNIEQMTGYKPISTFWNDFSIADAFGTDAVFDTFKKVFAEWHEDYKMFTELILVLNHKIWYWYEKDDKLSKLYNLLWERMDLWAQENLKGDELDYYYRTTD